MYIDMCIPQSNLGEMKMTPKQEFINSILKPGESYAGIILGKGDEPDYHLILVPGDVADINHADATAWAKFVGGELPTRREQSLLITNLKDQFESRSYWSCEQYTADSPYAYYQSFTYGSQGIYSLAVKLRARAVRRVPIK